MEEKFETNLKELREKNGMSQDELARRVGVTRETIRNVERGKTVPNVLLAIAIAGIFLIAVDKLFKSKG